MKYKYENYDPNQNRILDEELYAFLKKADSTRYVHKSSSTEEHPWFGWYSGTWQDYSKPSKHPFITEFGAQALPDLESLRKIFKEEELWPDSEKDWEKWEYHNFQRRETFEIAGVKTGKNIHEFIENTQQYQARLIKYAAESYRRQRFSPVTGVFQFMFVENWPSMNWGIVDYWRNPKPGYEALKTAFQPVLPSIEWKKRTWQKGETFSVNLWLINDLFKRFEHARLEYAIIGKDREIYDNSIQIEIEPDSIKKVISISRNDLNEGAYELIATIYDHKGECLGQNSFKFLIKK
jgi:beta-mannosidase